MSEDALAQCVAIELGDRSSVEIAGAYRALCAAILLRTAMVARAKTPPRKQDVDQKRTAIKWVAGGRGLITFEEACSALEMNPDRARNSIRKYVSGGCGGSINKGRPRSRTIYARRKYAPRPVDDDRREAAAADGVDARTPDDPGNRHQPAWA